MEEKVGIMMQKNGFTLTELMAVIIVLGLLIGIASFGVVNAINRSKGQAASKMRDELLDSAVAYGLENIFLKKCSLGFDPKEPTKNGNDNGCFKGITAKLIIEDEAIYRDDAKHCNRDEKIIIYNYQGDGISEYRAYASEDICNN